MKPSAPNWCCFVQEPPNTENPDSLEWNGSADTVVAGLGDAGAPTAIE